MYWNEGFTGVKNFTMIEEIFEIQSSCWNAQKWRFYTCKTLHHDWRKFGKELSAMHRNKGFHFSKTSPEDNLKMGALIRVEMKHTKYYTMMHNLVLFRQKLRKIKDKVLKKGQFQEIFKKSVNLRKIKELRACGTPDLPFSRYSAIFGHFMQKIRKI